MNSHDNSYSSRAAEAGRKRAAAKKLIEQYYFQLTQGCGNPQCDNKHCASNPYIQKLEPNEAAALALRLLKAKAQLCVTRSANGTTVEGKYLNSRPSGIRHAAHSRQEVVKGIDDTDSVVEENSHMDVTNCSCNCNVVFPSVQHCLVSDSNGAAAVESSSPHSESVLVPHVNSIIQEPACGSKMSSEEASSMDVSTCDPCSMNQELAQSLLGDFVPVLESPSSCSASESCLAPGSSSRPHLLSQTVQDTSKDHNAILPEEDGEVMDVCSAPPDSTMQYSDISSIVHPENFMTQRETACVDPNSSLSVSLESFQCPRVTNSSYSPAIVDASQSPQVTNLPISKENSIARFTITDVRSLASDATPTCKHGVPCKSSENALSAPSTSVANTSTFDMQGNKEPNKGNLYLDENSLLSIIEDCKKEQKFSLLIRTLGQVFSSEDSLQHSFVKPVSLKDMCKEEIRAMEVDEDKDHDSRESKEESPEQVTAKNCEITVDVESVRRSFKALFSLQDYPFQCALINALIILSENLEFDLKYGSRNVLDGPVLNIFVIVMEIPMLECPEYMEAAFPAFCKAAALLPVSAQAKLATTWCAYDAVRLKEMVDTLHQFITLKVITGQFNRDFCINDDETVVAATKLMKILYYANMLGGVMETDPPIEESEQASEEPEDYQDLIQGAIGSESKEQKEVKEDALGQELGIKPIDCRSPVISFSEFYNEPLSDQIEMDRDFACYKTDGGKFSFMNYAFILTPAVKALGLYYDNRIRMYSERRISVLHSLVHGAPPNPYLKLRVRRDHLIDDALVGLEMVAMENPNNLKKQLVVEFEGEQGIDEGGVSKEFFQLVVEEVFNPDFAMFTLNPETQTYWFNPTSFESDGQFTLIGIILGLAIYNNIILDVHFPMVLYQKLMGKKGTSYDLQDWNPSLSKGLSDLLAYEGDDIESVYLQTFRITYQDVFGTILSHDLKENGDKVFVNQLNKKEFVELYASFLLNKAVEKQFRAFRRGFQMVTDDSPLKLLFRPEEIELLVCGSKNFDFNALEEATDYDGGYLADTPIIKWFWELVHEFNLEQKRKLLQFATGSDRVPVGGLSKLKLVIARHGPDSERLPTAHTCFNVLLLPEYSSKEKLEERLLKAINYSKGFGML